MRFAKGGVLFMLAVAAGIARFWTDTWSLFRSQEAFAAFVVEREDSIRCRVCGLPYESALMTTMIPLGAITILVAALTWLAFARAFGPPVVQISGTGHGVYRAPWRVVRFTVPPNARIKIGPVFRFDPPVFR